MLRPSMGESRVAEHTTGWLSEGSRMTRPRIISGSSHCAAFMSAICPSYSSPWLPAVKSSVGPSPLAIEMMGIWIEPQADSSREWGMVRKPRCLPGAPTRMEAVTRAGAVEEDDPSMMLCSRILPSARHGEEGLHVHIAAADDGGRRPTLAADFAGQQGCHAHRSA